jgi:hypothetical protein
MFGWLFGRGKGNRPTGDAAHSMDEGIRGIRVGDVVSVNNLWPDYVGIYFVVDEVHRYAGPTGEWYELLGEEGGREIWIEWSEEDESFVTVSKDRTPMGLSSLNLTPDDLVRLDEDHSIDNFITYEGKRYLYKNSGEAFYYRNNEGDGAGFYLWDFSTEAGTDTVSIVKWENTPFQVYASEIVPPDGITVYKR